MDVSDNATLERLETRTKPLSDPIKIGRVVSVSGSQVVTLLEEQRLADASGGAPALQIGALVKMLTPRSTVFGMVSALSIPMPKQEGGAIEVPPEMKIAELEVIGEAIDGAETASGRFQRGVGSFPALGDAVYATTQDDLAMVYARPSEATLKLGVIHQDRSLPAYVVTDDLLGKHFAILGTTGTGKSCAVALTLQTIIAQNENAHVVVLDPHDEYSAAFGDHAEALNPGTLKLPYWLFNLEEIAEVIFGADSKMMPTETAILSEFIQRAKQAYHGSGEEADYITADTPVPYGMDEVVRMIDEAMGRLQQATADRLIPYQRLRERLHTLQADRRFAFMFDALVVRDNMAKILSQIFRIPVEGKPLTVVNLSGVPSEILNVVVSVLCRMTFDLALWSSEPMPILLVCEEAHRYAPQDDRAGFEPAKRALSRIAKEGRKYGVSLCMVSQRPSELAASVVSQCNTIFAMRMSNQKDQEFVLGALSESTVGLLDSLPSLQNAEAIVVGEGVSVPMRIRFEELPEDRRPRSGTAVFSSSWQSDNGTENYLDDLVDRWRRQRL